MTVYGWYSEEAFITNKIGYIYTDKNNISKLCTIVSCNNICPYYQPLNIYKETVEFIGELHKFICPINYQEDTSIDKILDESRTNRIERLRKLES